MNRFAVDPAIIAVSRPVASLKLCEALLMDDARFPWLVLVPRRTGARELDHLKDGDRTQLMDEVALASAAVRAMGAAAGRPVEKINVGALGNVTPQLHVHVVGRRADDGAWPGAVWGQGEAQAYDASALARMRDVAAHGLGAPSAAA